MRVRSHFAFFMRHSAQEDPPTLGRQTRPGNSQPKMTQRSNTNDLPFTMQHLQLLVGSLPGDLTQTCFLVHSVASHTTYQPQPAPWPHQQSNACLQLTPPSSS